MQNVRKLCSPLLRSTEYKLFPVIIFKKSPKQTKTKQQKTNQPPPKKKNQKTLKPQKQKHRI